MTEQELLQHSQAWDRAIVSNNVIRIRSFMSDDWICIATNGGITNIETFLHQINEGVLMHTELSTPEGHARVYGNTGIVVGRGYSKGKFRGMEFSFHEWSASVFVLIDGIWKCVLTVLTDVDSPVCGSHQ